jgi:ArsR family transcriptional regulator, arsenate/arsenite/antimonite-responsive transcriptional repressor
MSDSAAEWCLCDRTIPFMKTKLKDYEVAEIGKALGDPNRLSIYTHIAKHKEAFCGEIHAEHAISAATLSHHLKVLADLGLITSRKEGLNVYYRAIPERLAAYLDYLAKVALSKE